MKALAFLLFFVAGFFVGHSTRWFRIQVEQLHAKLDALLSRTKTNVFPRS